MNRHTIQFLKYVLYVVAFSFVSVLLFTVRDSFAEAVKSDLTLTVSSGSLSVDLLPGTFGKSTNATISVTTNNFSGYNLSISMDESRNLVNGNNAIQPISSSVSEATFVSDVSYYNKWGYKPSQYVTTSGTTHTVVQNTDFLPAPSLEGDLIAFTNSANSQADQYTFSFAAKVNSDIPEGDYVGTYVITAVPNPIVYNITYDDNTADEVTGMPSPNPQVITIDGGTPVAESYGVISNTIPIRSERSFGGWCDETTTEDSTTHNDVCGGTTYDAGDHFPIDQTADGSTNILYAIWLVDPFPMVWSHMGKCEFHGNTPSNITGSECTEYSDKLFIDTEIPLYSQANASKDYEIHFKIDEYDPSLNRGNDNQQTFVSSKVPSSTTIGGGDAAGLVVRRSGTQIDVNSRMNTTSAQNLIPVNGLSDLSVYRINSVIYYSINGGPLVLAQDITGYNQYFDLTTWFGAYPATSRCDGSVSNPCNTSKRYIEAEFSEMYIRLGDFDDSNLHNITFNSNGGTPATSTYLVVEGHALGTLPAPLSSGYVLVGWYTSASGGTEITEQTVPHGNDVYYAHWAKSVSQALIESTDITVARGETESIVVTNAAEIEPYTFTSNDTNVATVDSATGVITGVSSGTTTITMTGTKSGETRTINVTVSSVVYTLTLNAEGGTTPSTVTVADGGTLSTIPGSSKPGYSLDGWYSGQNGTGTKLTTNLVFTSSTPKIYYAYWVQVEYVCTIATSLHQETCERTSGGCKAAHYATNSKVTYGRLVDSSTMRYGDAYNCDVDSNGIFDTDNERFYYIGMDGDNATFIHSMSTQETTDLSYTDALAALPTSQEWSNSHLVLMDGSITRFPRRSEIQEVCGSNDAMPTNLGVDGNCVYLMEDSNFTVTTRRDGVWIVKEGDTRETTYRYHTSSNKVTNNTSANTARPVIEVPLAYVERGTDVPPVLTYTVTFEPHNGSQSSDVIINAGDALGSDYPSPDPTYTDHLFQGWYTAATGGTLVTSATEPEGDVTYHAQWKGTVALANITNTQLAIVEGNTDTIVVSNASDIEAYTLTSNNTSIATVDSATGIVTGVAAGSTTITMEGNTSHATRTITVDVSAQVATKVTISFNTHGGSAVSDIEIDSGDPIGTLPAAPVYADHLFQGWFTAETGGTQIDGTERPLVDTTYHAQWKKTVALAELDSDEFAIPLTNTETITVTNASELESYTFSSANSSIATVDSATGAITATSTSGTTTITMTGTTSGATKTINVTTADILCKLAESGTLHSGTIKNTVYDYGQIVNSATLHAGDAYDCDIDNDGIYSATDERFYYLATENESKVFFAYRNYQNRAWAPKTTDSSVALVYGHSEAPTMLPLTADWDHPGLTEQAPGFAARFATYDEVNNACGVSNIGTKDALLDCPYFMENTASDGYGRSAMWLKDEPTAYWRIHAGTSNRNVVTISSSSINTSQNAIRPTIVVPTKWVEQYKDKITISFNSHGGSSVSDIEIDSGDPIGTLPAAPIYADHLFQGWFTADTGGTQIDGTERPLVDTTYHAQWKGTVALANLNSSSFSIVQGGSSTLTVSNASDIEAYSLTSNDTSVATVNTSSGEITAAGVGSTTITMEGVASHATRTIDVTVVSSGVKYTISFNTHGGSGVASYDINPGETVGTLPTSTLANNVLMGWYENETGGNPITSDTMPVASTTYHAQWKLDVNQATLLNPDLTLSVGGQINLNVTNASALEPYTLSSGDTSVFTVDQSGNIDGVGAGTATLTMTGGKSGINRTFTVDVLAAPAVMRHITFNAQGGQSVQDIEVEDGTAIGTLPTTTKTNNKFFGWYTDSSLSTEVKSDLVINEDKTFYAKWIGDTNGFPIVWSRTDEQVFSGNNYLDTGIALYNSTNYDTDYEIGFKIVSFTPSVSQETIFNEKYELQSVGWPGIMMRSSGTTSLEMAHTINSHKATVSPSPSIGSVTDVRIVRDGKVVKYAYNGGQLTTLQDLNDTSIGRQEFNTNVWFGASATSNNTPQRYSHSVLTDLYIRLGTYEENGQYTIRFDAKGGNASETVRYIDQGDPVGTLPTATKDGNYTFVGWYTTEDDSGELVTASRTPQGNETYYAHWDYTSSLVPVPFDVSNNATRGYQNILSGMLPQLTQFTEDTTTIVLDPSGNPKPSINFSSWGVDKTTYMTALKNNFETNSCFRPTYEDSSIDNWAAGSVDCAKPDAYNTGVGGAVNVYLFNTNESPKGASVAYARAESGYIHNMIPGKTYYWEDASDANNYGVVTATSGGGVRWIDAGQVRNVRDLGGLPVSYTDANNNTVTGTVDYGRLVRGERLWSSTDNRTAIQNLGITRQYDLATAGELNDIKFESPNYINDTVVHYNFDYGTSSYSYARKAVTDIMTDIVAGENIYFHCRVGADRTGTVAYLLEGLLGVEDENRYEEYELTYLSGHNDRTRYYDQKADNNYYKFLFMMGYTLTKSKILEWYLAGSSNTTADMDLVQRFRTAMIIPTSNNNGSGGNSGGDSGQNSSNSTNNASPLALNQSMSNSTDSTNSSSDTFTDGYTSYADPLGASQTAASSMTVSNEVAAGLAVATTAIGITCGAIAYTLGKQEVDASE